MKHLRLGTRITLWSAIVVALGILLCGIGVTIFIHQERVEELDRQLEAEAQHFLREWKLHGGRKFDWARNSAGPREWSPAASPRRYVEVVDPQGAVLYRTPEMPDFPVVDSSPGERDIRLAGKTMRLAVFPEDGIQLRLIASYWPIHEQTRDLVVAFLCALPVILVFVFLGGRWIARKAVEPIQGIIASAETITAQHLDQRLPLPPAHDEIHRLAVVLNDTLDRLDHGFRQATRFTADASHELKTPLTVLRTSVETLLRSPELTSNSQRAVAGLLEQTKKLSSITASLLLLSRADVGKLSLDLTRGDLAEIVGLCVEDLKIIAEEREIEIAITTPPSAPALVDRTRASQIVMNILDNAVKYNDDRGKVRVALAASDGHWALAVSNTGAGIPADVAPQLFTRFYRGEHTSAIGGHGLGLSLSRELALAHGGDLRFERSEEGWTTFVLTVPRIEERPPV